MSQCMVVAMVSGDRLRFFAGVFDGADHVERLLGEVVRVAVEDRLEAAYGVFAGNVLAFLARELLGDEHRLREELLHLARAVDERLVFLGEFVHAEDGDDVAQFLVALQGFLHAAGGVRERDPHDI